MPEEKLLALLFVSLQKAGQLVLQTAYVLCKNGKLGRNSNSNKGGLSSTEL